MPRIRILHTLLAASLGALGLNHSAAEVVTPSVRDPVDMRFAVAQGTRLRKTFTRELELTTLRKKSRVALATWSDSQRIVLVDEYGPLEDQVPETIVRSFEEIGMEHSHRWEIPSLFEDFSGKVEREGRGELMGSRVTFTRDRAEHEIPFGTHEASYVAALADDSDASDESAVALADLRSTTDSTSLLPWRKVAVGDHWFVDVGAFDELCWPGGALGFEDSKGEPLVTPVDERLGRNLDGTFRVELLAVEEVEGVAYAQMSLRGFLDSETTFDYEWVVSFMEWTFTYKGPITLELYASVRGRLWWNLDAGHLDSIHLEGEVAIDQDFAGIDEESRSLSRGVDWKRAWTGTLRADADFERL